MSAVERRSTIPVRSSCDLLAFPTAQNFRTSGRRRDECHDKIARSTTGMTFATSLGRMSGMPGSDPLDPARAGVKLTYDDFVLFPDDGKRHESIDEDHY